MMQAVILAAGRGTRMEELTGNIPKPMLTVAGKSLLEYKLDALPDEIEEVVIIIGYLGNTIKGHFGGRHGSRKIRYVEQEKLDGTAGALWRAREVLTDSFLVMMGDDIYTGADIEQCIAAKDWALLVQQIPHLRRAGDVRLDDAANITDIIEGDQWEEPGLASTNMFKLDARLFSQPLIPKQEGSPEYGLPQTVVAASHALGIRLEPIFTDKWIQITSPKDLVRAEQALKEASK